MSSGCYDLQYITQEQPIVCRFRYSNFLREGCFRRLGLPTGSILVSISPGHTIGRQTTLWRIWMPACCIACLPLKKPKLDALGMLCSAADVAGAPRSWPPLVVSSHSTADHSAMRHVLRCGTLARLVLWLVKLSTLDMALCCYRLCSCTDAASFFYVCQRLSATKSDCRCEWSAQWAVYALTILKALMAIMSASLSRLRPP